MSSENLANPGPLGLMGFGTTTVLLNLHNAGFYGLNTMILAMGIFYGGIAQIIAGILEYKKGNTFGMVAFISYGSFWLTLVFLIVSPWGLVAPDKLSMAMYFIVWGTFTLFMFIGTLKASRGLQVVFGTLVILYALLAIRDLTFSGSPETSALFGTIAGWEGLFCGMSAMYMGFAEVLNDKFGKIVLPVG